MNKGEESVEDRRGYSRVKSLHLLSYIPKKERVEKYGVAMGRTLDISAIGVGLEVFQPIKAGSEVEVEIAIRESIFPAHGKVIHCRKTHDMNYIVGVKFDQVQEELANSFLKFDSSLSRKA